VYVTIDEGRITGIAAKRPRHIAAKNYPADSLLPGFVDAHGHIALIGLGEEGEDRLVPLSPSTALDPPDHVHGRRTAIRLVGLPGGANASEEIAFVNHGSSRPPVAVYRGAMAQRELTGDEIDALLRSQRIVRIAFSGGNRMYVLPLGYLWTDGALHLMTSAGQKTAMADANARVAFQIDDAAETGMLGWSSITGEGEWEVITAKAAQMKVGAALIARFPELLSWSNREAAKKATSGALIFARIKPLWMTGRAFLPE
jgi:uncharacterized protein